MLSERISELEKDLVVREEEVGHLALQLELKHRESRATEEQVHVHIAHLQVWLWSQHTCLMRVVWQSYYDRMSRMFTILDKLDL